MTIRLTSNEPISFDITGEVLATTRTMLRNDLIDYFRAHIAQQLSSTAVVGQLIEELRDNIAREWATNEMASHVAQHVNYGYLVDNMRREFISHLMNDERVRSRIMRAVSDATVGVTNEVVERVLATLDEKTNPQTADA